MLKNSIRWHRNKAVHAGIDLSNAKGLEGKPMTYALNNLKDVPMRVNRMNVDAIQLLGAGPEFRGGGDASPGPRLEPENPFTLNNLGVAEEATGNLTERLAAI